MGKSSKTRQQRKSDTWLIQNILISGSGNYSHLKLANELDENGTVMFSLSKPTECEGNDQPLTKKMTNNKYRIYDDSLMAWGKAEGS